MLSVCGDFPSYPASVLFDPSGGYLFLNDQSISSTVIAAIDLIHDTLTETGSSIAGNPSIISFSPDATTVYAVEGKNVLAYGFNSSSGSLTSEGSVSLPLNVGAIVAASRP
jgi:DNA-binding beta-propeller fold protein YncE